MTPLLPEVLPLLAPPERLTPSDWAERHRVLSREESTQPGPWRNDVFPYLRGVQDAALEAVSTGKQGLVLMKSGQGGGTQAVLNIAGWAKCELPGPLAYVCAKDDQATEMARTRIKPLIRNSMLNERARWGRTAGELVNRFRFVDGPWMVVGGRAVTNLEAFPQRVIIFDELDSIQDEFTGGKGDPLANALIRMASFTVPTLAVVLAHPTTADRGAGRVYYEESDQRRAFAPCAHCGDEFWLQWDHVRVFPGVDETPEEAARRPERYAYVTPCCSVVLEDEDRWWMADRTTQRTTLDAEAAAARRWIGVHFSWLYMRSKTLEELAYNWVKSEGKPAERRVVINKQLGDVYKEVAREADPDAWRACATGAYELGTVPREVQFLTAGQDSRGAELHWAVWGWGLVRDSGGLGRLCGWLIDCGVERRVPPRPSLEAADLGVFDQVLYERMWPRVDGGESLWLAMGLHDSGWQPVAVYAYCLGRRDGRAFPSTGAGLDDVSAARTQVVQMGVRPGFKDPITGQQLREAHEQKVTLNTYVLKSELVGMVDAQFPTGDGRVQGRVVLPRGVSGRFLAESGSEYLTRNEKGRLEWRHRGPNHFADCNVMALGAAIYLARDLRETADEVRGRRGQERARRVQAEQAEEDLRERGGGWWSGSRGGGWA